VNYRRALRISTDFGLYVFLAGICGVLLWTVDEVLEWNLLPDWIDKYAQVLVMVLAILAGFSVVISLMCSFAMIAEAAAEKAGLKAPPPSGKARRIIIGSMLAALLVMFGLSQLNDFRAARAERQEKLKRKAQSIEGTKKLAGRIDEAISLFTPKYFSYLKDASSSEASTELEQLMRAIRRSFPLEPEVHLLVQANSPYKFYLLSDTQEGEVDYNYNPPRRVFKRQFLTTFPKEWELRAVERLFAGETVTLPADTKGLFLNTDGATAWGVIREQNQVLGILLLKGTRFE
jgi:hypothetical protein